MNLRLSLFRKNILLCLCVIAILFYANRVKAQGKTEIFQPSEKISFEENLPKTISVAKGNIELSKKHRTTGANSLRWNFEPYDTLTIKGEIGYQPQKIREIINLLGKEYPQKDKPVGFRFPIYSEEYQDVQIRFAFGDEKAVACYTDVTLNFNHWYEFTMGYDLGHLKGTPREDMNQFQIIVKSDKAGTIFLDDLEVAIKVNHSSLAPSTLELFQTNYPHRPIINGADLRPDSHKNKPWFPLNETITQKEKEAFRTIENRLFEQRWGGKTKIAKLDETLFQELESKFNSYHISKTEDGIIGDYHINKRKYNTLLKEIALRYYKVIDKGQKKELGAMAIQMIEHAFDINLEITWYGGNGFSDACYLVRDKLKEAGLLEKTIFKLKEKLFFGRMYDEDSYQGQHAGKGLNTDDLFSNLISTVIVVLLMDDSPEKVRDMRHLVSFHNNVALIYTPGPSDGFKPDGTMFHHVNAYLERYGYYTMPVICEFVYILSKTDFRLSEETHERMKKNVEARCFYKSQHYFPWAYAHNMVRPVQKAAVNEVLSMALAGSPDGKEDIDKEMAALYLLFMQGEKLPDTAKKIIAAGILPAPVPQGHKTLSYYAKGLHRKDDWFITVGAFSKYVYQSEMWQGRADGRGDIKTNKFVNWGQTEIIYPDKPDFNFINNGWDLDGWDWTRFPGTTALKTPLERIQTTVTKGVEHLRSDQPFVGGLDFTDGNGVFVAKIRGHHKYKLDSFYATKTYFFFGDLMVCLGSDITNDLPEYMTQTTLLQNALKDEPFKLYINTTKPLKDTYFEKSFNNQNNWMLDSRAIGYYIPEGQNLNLSYSNQKSRDDHDSKNTEGVFETAWLNHGHAPDNDSYEYAIKVKTNAKEMKAFAEKMESKNKKVYHVLQADKNAHIVAHPESGTKAYILFQKNYNLNSGVLKGVSHSSIVMTKETGGTLTLGVSDPDLRFFEGYGTDVDLNLVRHEENSYALSWYASESIPSKIKVFLKGEWKIDQITNQNATIVQIENGITVVAFECQHGLTSEVVLTPI